jgi:rubrerythrin
LLFSRHDLSYIFFIVCGGVLHMLKRLVLRVILEEAIAFEEAAYRFYQSALESAVMEESGSTLRKLLVSELKHRMKLDDFQRRGELGNQPVVSETGLEELEKIAAPWPQLHPWSTRQEILEAALHKEQSAYEFYRRMSEKAVLGAVRDAFRVLAEEELQHIGLLQAELGEKKE